MLVIQKGAKRGETGSGRCGEGARLRALVPGGTTRRAAPEIDFRVATHHALTDAGVASTLGARRHLHFHPTERKGELLWIEHSHEPRLSNDRASNSAVTRST